ncbi:putative GTPase activating protein [Trypanosoma rangeli]|uniref:Putative GTPase activating protein n=1 Tax=Trypanosoma rangeli TaxID=5698 RepID=A0A3R7RF00_TRYRA|nr:putative GTPase activating protein [Trypanosoma rangeli]RNF01359.1 putative GTPase activating protein [Trypanosoma rangeli]|eukprot:RNF01359.1 putative GTPase activating protein [Trypanosoma rangeli]
MFSRMKEGIVRRFTSAVPERNDKSSHRQMPIKGRQLPILSSNRCESTVDVLTKKSRALPEESLHDEEVLRKMLAEDPVDLDKLCSICRSGCPAPFRREVWDYLTGNLQPFSSSRATVLARKRQEYVGYVQSSYSSVDWDAALRVVGEGETTRVSATSAEAKRGDNTSPVSVGAPSNIRQRQAVLGAQYGVPGESELLMLKQIRKDVPRMAAGVAYLYHARVMLSIERILYIWALRHPACGYVQGMNDLLIPFISVILASQFCPSKTVAELHSLTETDLNVLFSTEAVSEEEWMYTIEADTYWMASYLLSAVQENYTYNQKGICSMVRKLEAVTRAVDAKLHRHLREELRIGFNQFAFRWMNCLLLRELNATQSLRLWDTYLADVEKDWSTTHVYVCAALLVWWSPALCKETDYGAVMKFLQNLPTEELSTQDLSALISQGVMMQKLYNDTLQHLR